MRITTPGICNMTHETWTIDLIGQAKRADKRLSLRAAASFSTLLIELEGLGPYRKDWHNYGKLRGEGESYHCHLEKGRPTYVACWRIVDKRAKRIEVYYAGTHEDAPY